jgi:putative ABC transport system permease protein
VSALATSLRIARRDALRFKARSALVVVMIALPVLGVGAADVLYRTFQLSPEQKATRLMGAAQATYLRVSGAPITQDAHSQIVTSREGPPSQPTAAFTSFLPLGSRSLSDRVGEADLSVGRVTTKGQLRALDYTDPLAKGLYRQTSGRAARTADEVVLTEAYARRLHVGLGATVSSRGRTAPYTVVGLVQDGSFTNRLTALVSPQFASAADPQPFLVSLPRVMTWDDVKRANAAGYLVRPRHRLAGTPALQGNYQPATASSPVTAISLVVGMVLLEIILLAGPAFAVGAKRQSRELALLAATGGERRDVRRTVLASGVVLGAAGGLLGVLAGIALGRFGVPQVTARTSSVPGPFDVRFLDLGALALVGVTTAVLAAVIPARNASRQDVVAALTGRRGQLRSLRRTPVIGVAVAVIGTIIAFRGAEARSVNTILAGSALAELGLVATTPFLVGLVGRLSPWLPLGPRLALRDASRNRGRTAPAVSAVLAAVAGSVAVGTYFASTDRFKADAYEPTAPRGAITVPFESDEQRAKLSEVEAALRRTIPGVTVTVVMGLLQYGPDQRYLDITRHVLRCSVQPGGAVPTRAELLAASRDPACHGHAFSSRFFGTPVVGGPEVLKALTGQQNEAYAAVLARGGLVGSREDVDPLGKASLRVLRSDVEPGRQHPSALTVPALALPPDAVQLEVLSPAAARRTGMTVLPIGLVASRSGVPSSAEEDQTRKALQDLAISGLEIERGYQSTKSTGLLALLLGSAVIVLGASGIATGLAAADGKADLATLAAVGADPTTRRTLAAFQSAVTAGLGTLLGAVAGLVPAIGMVRALNASALHASFPRLDPYPLVLPWTNILVTVLVVPLVAALAAALLTRSKLPLVRRLA